MPRLKIGGKLASQGRGRPAKTPLDRFESSLLFSSLKSISEMTWLRLENSYRKDVGLGQHNETDTVEDFRDYAAGEREPRIADDTPSPVDWTLRTFPGVRAAQETIIFKLLRSRRRGADRLDDPGGQEDTNTDLLHEVSGVVLDATDPYVALSTRIGHRVLRLPEHRLRRDLDAIAGVDHLDALAVLLIGVMESRSMDEAIARALLCRQWLRRWTLTRPEHRRSYAHLLKALESEMPQLGPLTGEKGLHIQMDDEQEHQLVLRCNKSLP